MDTRSKYESRFQAIALSCDAFTTAYLVMCLLFLAPYTVTHGGYLVLWFLPISCVLPFAIMPLVYKLIHRFDTLLFGRYHFAMPLSAFLAALFFVLTWSAKDSGAGSACLVFFCFTVFAVFIMTYRYCAFSVRARLSGSGIVNSSPQFVVFGEAGAVAAICAFIGFMKYDPETVYVNTAYTMAGACVLLALIQYLATYHGVPRLGGKRVQSTKDVFRAFYSGLDKRMYSSSLLFEAAFVTVAALITCMCIAAGMDIVGLISVVAVLVAVFAVAAILGTKLITHRSIVLSVIDLTCVILSAAALTVLACVKPTGGFLVFGMIVAAAPVGLGGAVALRQTKLRFLTVKPLITGGTVYLLLELTLFAAVAVAFLVAAVVATVLHFTSDATAFIYGFAFAAVLCVAAFCVAGKTPQKPPSAPRQSYEYSALQATDDGDLR